MNDVEYRRAEARLWDAVSPVFPFYIPLVTMVAVLPLMWAKFKSLSQGAAIASKRLWG